MSATVTERRGPYAKTAEVRRKILESCLEVFGSFGFHGTTMKEIAERTGMSQTGLLHHFPTKTDLLMALLDLRYEREQNLALHDDVLDSVRGILDVVAANRTEPGVIELVVVLSAEATAEHHPAHTYFHDRYERIREGMTNAFLELESAGELRSEFDPPTLACMLLALIDGLQLQWLYHRNTIDMEAVLRNFLCSIIPALAH